MRTISLWLYDSLTHCTQWISFQPVDSTLKHFCKIVQKEFWKLSPSYDPVWKLKVISMETMQSCDLAGVICSHENCSRSNIRSLKRERLHSRLKKIKHLECVYCQTKKCYIVFTYEPRAKRMRRSFRTSERLGKSSGQHQYFCVCNCTCFASLSKVYLYLFIYVFIYLFIYLSIYSFIYFYLFFTNWYCIQLFTHSFI